MSDPDPRIQALAEAAFIASGLLTMGDWFQSARRFLAMYDAIRAYDAAHTPVSSIDPGKLSGHCSALSAASWAIHSLTNGGRLLSSVPYGEIATAAIEAAKAWEIAHPQQPQPESEVVPHSGQHSVPEDKPAAPLVGADPPWLDEAAKAAHDAAGLHDPADNWFGRYDEGERDEWRRAVRASLAVAIAHLTDVAVVEAADKTWELCGDEDPFAAMRAALAAARQDVARRYRWLIHLT